MKLFKYDQFISESKEDIESICRKYGIRNYTINEDGTIDVDGHVDLSRKNIDKLPLKFGKVGGSFYCSYNQLTSLEGSPNIVGGDFSCSSNQLTSLEGSPNRVGGDFSCSDNQLTSLEGSPNRVGGYFSCSSNQLTSLEGCPTEVDGSFSCSYNKLTSLEGSPNRVGGVFYCHNNKLVNVKGFPLVIGGDVSIKGNPVEEIFKLFPKDRWKEVPEHLNEYNVIRDGRKIILQALEVVYDELVLEVPENIEIKGYEII
jgi:hypothetical protein